MRELLDLCAVDLAAAMRRGDVAPVEVLDTHIARIEKVNPVINALVADRFELARQEARAAAERLCRPDPPPILGVPCTVKEFVAVEGMPQTAGIVYRWDARATEDATAVARLREAGAIVLGVTNAPEGGLWMETNNLVYGRTNNPWDPSRTPGGSSGGEGAMIAAGGSPFGLGSDVGGSIRIPAAFCGIAGHKPTGRLVPNTGHWPPTAGDVNAYNCIGPLARSARDLWPLLRILAGPDGRDPLGRALGAETPEAVDLRHVTTYAVPALGRARMSAPVLDALERAGQALAGRGAARSELVEPRLKDVFSIWSAMLALAAGESYAELLGDGRPIPVLREVLRFPFGRANHTTLALAVVLLESLQRQMPGHVGAYSAEGRALQADLERLLGDGGVLLVPAYTRPAPRHRAAMLTPFDIVCTALFNVLEFPSTVVRAGFDPQGLPIGIQVVGGRGMDHLTIAVAQALEAELGGWVRAEPAAGDE